MSDSGGGAEDEGTVSEDSDGVGGGEEELGTVEDGMACGEPLFSELDGGLKEGGKEECVSPPLPSVEDGRDGRCENASRPSGLESPEDRNDSLLLSLPFDENVGSGFPAVDLSSDDADSLSCPLLSTSIKAELVPLGNEDVELSGVF